jgi:hypothetical protein
MIKVSPARVGPCRFGRLGRWITIRCPSDLAPVMRQAGGAWDPGRRQWCIDERRIGPLVRTPRRQTDWLFRQAAIDLDKI